MMSKKRVLLSSIFGNALEFYDFTLYGVLASVLAKHYFPGGDDTAKLLFSLAAFAVGFFIRPMGAMLFGHLGDTLGRKEALSLSVLLMGIPTFLIGIAPSYQEVGLLASILVFTCRLLQGVFTGGEYNGAAIFSIEHLGKRSPGLVGGLITGSCVIGAITATFLGAWTQRLVCPSGPGDFPVSSEASSDSLVTSCAAEWKRLLSLPLSLLASLRLFCNSSALIYALRSSQ